MSCFVLRVILYRAVFQETLGFLLDFSYNEHAEVCIVASWSNLKGATLVRSTWTLAYYSRLHFYLQRQFCSTFCRVDWWAWFSLTIGSLISLIETSIEPIIYKILLFDALHRCSRNLLVRHINLFRSRFIETVLWLIYLFKSRTKVYCNCISLLKFLTLLFIFHVLISSGLGLEVRRGSLIHLY